MFITQAWADEAVNATAKAAEQGSFFMSVLPLVIIFVFFYLIVLRPQSKKIREHQQMINILKAGDKVLTGAGFYATIVKISDTDVTLEIASGVHVKAQKHTVVAIQDAPLPANDLKAKK
jgi:preprotein translocase subunit YajC